MTEPGTFGWHLELVKECPSHQRAETLPRATSQSFVVDQLREAAYADSFGASEPFPVADAFPLVAGAPAETSSLAPRALYP